MSDVGIAHQTRPQRDESVPARPPFEIAETPAPATARQLAFSTGASPVPFALGGIAAPVVDAMLSAAACRRRGSPPAL